MPASEQVLPASEHAVDARHSISIFSIPIKEERLVTEKVIIVGSGPAGWTAAIYAARADLQPLVYEGAITQENQQLGTLPLGQLNLTTEVENFPAWPHVNSDVLREFAKSALPADRYGMLQHLYDDPEYKGKKRAAFGPEQMEFMRQQAVNFGTRIITEDVVEVDFSRRPFKLTPGEGDPVEAHSVIIATGARANYLGLESEDKYKNRGVSACAVCDGALPLFRNRPLAVIGGGDSAVEEATYLTKFGSTVYLVHRRDELRASKIMAKRAMDEPKIDIKWNRVVDEVLGNGNQVTGVRLKSTVNDETEELEIAGMFLGIGHTPNTSFLKGQLELTDKNYVRWTQPQRTDTSVDGVFSAGDVSDAHYRQAVTAAATGCMAALDAERWLAAKGL